MHIQDANVGCATFPLVEVFLAPRGRGGSFSVNNNSVACLRDDSS